MTGLVRLTRLDWRACSRSMLKPQTANDGLHNSRAFTQPFQRQAKMPETGYDPKRSRVSEGTMADFQRATISGDLIEVPGLGPAAIKKMSSSSDDDEKVTNTFQLVGKFLMLKGPDEDGHKVESNEHMQKFWHWLAEKGISSHRSAIVLAIAEKMNTMMPGIYDPSDYDDDEE